MEYQNKNQELEDIKYLEQDILSKEHLIYNTFDEVPSLQKKLDLEKIEENSSAEAGLINIINNKLEIVRDKEKIQKISNKTIDFNHTDKIIQRLNEAKKNKDNDFLNKYTDYYMDLLIKYEQKKYFSEKKVEEQKEQAKNLKKWAIKICITLCATGALCFGVSQAFDDQETFPLYNQHKAEENKEKEVNKSDNIIVDESTNHTELKQIEEEQVKEQRFEEEPEMIKDIEATSYCACGICCGEYAKNRPIDENGNPIVEVNGHILKAHDPNHPENISSAATDTNTIPTGSVFKLYDSNGNLFGTFEAADTGNKVINKTVDVYTGYTEEAHQQALQNGRIRNMTVEIISKPEEKEYMQEIVNHTIQSGESLSSIAQRYNTTISEIQDYNNIQNSNLLQIGQELQIPARKEINKN